MSLKSSFDSFGLFKIAVLVLLSISFTEASGALPIRWECYGLLIPDFGTLVREGDKSPFSERERKEFYIYRFNEGQSGYSTVYRLISRTQEGVSKVIKVYRMPYVMQNDMAAFDVLDETNIGTSIQVVGRRPIEKYKRLELDDIRGRTLKAVLSDMTIDEAARKILLERYQHFLDTLSTLLKQRFAGRPVKIERRTYNFGAFHMRIDEYPTRAHDLIIFIKSDNIIVESGTTNMYLIDPY